MELSNILNFTKFLNKFQSVERMVTLPNTEHKENDIEHSYHLAMIAWYIAEIGSLNLDKNLLIKYSLIHDLVEVYAGDTFIYSKNPTDHETKHEREESARLRIQKELSEFSELHAAILDYEKLKNDESKFIYVLDKIHPIIQIYLDEGKNWKEYQITLQMLLEKKKNKMFLSPSLISVWNELEKILIENEDLLFHKK